MLERNSQNLCTRNLSGFHRIWVQRILEKNAQDLFTQAMSRKSQGTRAMPTNSQHLSRAPFQELRISLNPRALCDPWTELAAFLNKDPWRNWQRSHKISVCTRSLYKDPLGSRNSQNLCTRILMELCTRSCKWCLCQLTKMNTGPVTVPQRERCARKHDVNSIKAGA